MGTKGRFIALAVMFSVLLISGCGGGGGGSSPAVPPAPTGVTATAGDNEATIGWDNVAGATSYNLYYSATTGVPKATATKVTGVTSPHIVAGLSNGTAYYFVVTAVDAIGESADSVQASATPTATPAPPAPTGVTATALHGEASIGWDNVTGATSYNVYYSTTTGVTKTTGTKVAGATSPEIVTGLINGTAYYFVVTAVNADGESEESVEVSATPTAAPAPPAPENVAATAGDGSASIGWDNVTGATSYNVYYSTATGVTKTTGTKVAGATSPEIVTGLIRGTSYYFVVTAVNSDDVESADSEEATAIPDPPNPSYSQADLAGTWNIRVILSGTSPGWYGVTAAVDNSGNVTTSGPVGPATPPALPALSITSGTDNTAGVVTETGGNATFYGKMSTSKNLIVGTSTDGTTVALHVFVKRVPGVTFSDADLANTTFAYQRIYRGASLDWERGTGSTNGAGLMTLASAVNSSGAVFPLPSATNISVNGTTGIVSIAAESSFSGVMTPDKKIIVGASTDAAGIYSLRIIQMRGQTYTLADLAGVNHAFSFLATSASSAWARSIWTTDGSGNVTYESIVNSTPPDSAGGSFTQAMDAQGNAPDGTMSFGKDLLVTNGTLDDGSYIEVKVQ